MNKYSHKVMFVFITTILLSGCVHQPKTDNTKYPVLLYSDDVYDIHTQYYKRKDGSVYMKFYLPDGKTKQMEMYSGKKTS